MCGIFLHLFPTGSKPQDFDSLESLIKNRGRDFYEKIVNLKLSNCPKWSVCLFASVLSTQGSQVVKQPMMSSSGSFLLWNGDVFSGPDFTGEGCDTSYIFENLEKFGAEFLLKICGPYSFVYFDSAKSEIWFGRDVIGRHSLLFQQNDDSIILSSVSDKKYLFEELQSVGIFKIDLKKPTLELELHPWSHIEPNSYKFQNCKINDVFKHEILGQNPFDYESNEDYPKYLNIFEDEISSVYLKLVETDLMEVVEELSSRLFSSVEKRTVRFNRCRLCDHDCQHAKTAICFSGGLDSTLIALLASRSLPYDEPIDLFNVAFEKSDNFNVPDRIGGLKSFEELKRLEPNRKWNFVCIDVTKNELEKIRKEHIRDLIYPLNSVLDDSLGCALWFAVRGKGTVDGKNYTSNARVVLLGMGADELFGGYSRHKMEFVKNGWDSLGKLLKTEIRNIGKRNLGRDNRVVADHSRQPRMPFLDENLYSFVDKLPPWKKTYLSPNLKQGIGDKYLLRLVAHNLGLKYATTAPKKALQFGSRIANSCEKGHQRSERL